LLNSFIDHMKNICLLRCLVFLGPGVEELNLGGRWSEMDIAPTLLGILNISGNLNSEGKSMPIREGSTDLSSFIYLQPVVS